MRGTRNIRFVVRKTRKVEKVTSSQDDFVGVLTKNIPNGYWGGLLAGVFGLSSTLLTPVLVACAVLWYPVSVPDFVLS